MNTLARSLALASIALALSNCSSGNSASTGPGMENPITHDVTAADKQAAKSTAPIRADSATLWVNGMGCPLCASNIDRQLERISGVQDVKVDLGVGKVTLGFKPGVPHPSPARLGDAVEDAGFTLVKIDVGGAQ